MITKIKKYLFALGILLLTGCAPTRWYHDQGFVNFERDKMDCTMRGNDYVRSFGYGGNPFIVVMGAQDCLKSKGYYACSE